MKQLIIITLFASIIFADTIIVDQSGNGDYYTIQEAYNASSTGDTIFLNAGVYIENDISVTHEVHFVGIEKNSVLWTHESNDLFYNDSDGTSIREITFSGNYIICRDDLYVYDCIFNNTYFKNTSSTAPELNIRNSVFMGCSYAIKDDYGSQLDANIYNTIFRDISEQVFYDLGNLTVMNSIFYDINGGLDYSINSLSITYSCFFNSESNSGYGNITGNPLFVAGDPFDYHLQPASPCIDAGNPAGNHNDPDGSRNDMGVYGGPNSWGGLGPVITNIQVTPEEVQQGETITIQATGTVE